METADDRHERILREYEESKQKERDLGRYADVLIQLYVSDPDKISAEFILRQLVIEHEQIGFDKIKSREDETK